MAVQVSLECLQEYSPFQNTVWLDLTRPITRWEVRRALSQDRMESDHTKGLYSRIDHAARVAWLVQNGWSDPIQLDVGIPDMGCEVSWIIADGNHRLAAAFYRKDSSIWVEVAGDLAVAEKLLGVSAEEIAGTEQESEEW